MSVKINSHTDAVISRINNNSSIAVRLFIEDAHQRSTLTTPMKTGNLRKRVRKSISGNRGEIEWDTNYAIFQENPSRRFNYTTPGTGPHFAENAIEDTLNNLDSIIREVGE